MVIVFFIVEYVKFGKVGCKGCRKFIDKGEFCIGYVGKVNFGVMVWYYYDCLWVDIDSFKLVDVFKLVKVLV